MTLPFGFVGLLYVGYYFILIGALISEILDPEVQYANIATIAVTSSHFVVGSIEALRAAVPLTEFVLGRYNKIYNLGADVFITAALVLAAIGVSQSDPKMWITFTPISLALVGNGGCLYGRVYGSTENKTNTFLLF